MSSVKIRMQDIYVEFSAICADMRSNSTPAHSFEYLHIIALADNVKILSIPTLLEYLNAA
jgi:hypothetical protein